MIKKSEAKLKFRNLTVSPDDPVSEWGVEGMLAALDRGSLPDWQRIAAAVTQAPDGEAAEDLAVALDLAESKATATLLRLVLDRARETPSERVARKVREAIARSGLTQAEFAAALGTSASRLSTYASGKVSPSAVLMERMYDLSDQAAARVS